MADPFVGEIRPFCFNFIPVDWMGCWGQTVSITQYQVLYAVIGTYYGGDGRTTFQLPDLRCYAPLSRGNGPGLTSYPHVGPAGGSLTATLASPLQLPPHNHTWNVATGLVAAGQTATPSNSVVPCRENIIAAATFTPPPANVTFSSAAVAAAPTAPAQPHENRQPFLPLNFCICFQGLFPVRS
jgi:microcystin-dependent protein